jgi:hypothetical protein
VGIEGRVAAADILEKLPAEEGVVAVEVLGGAVLEFDEAYGLSLDEDRAVGFAGILFVALFAYEVVARVGLEGIAPGRDEEVAQEAVSIFLFVEPTDLGRFGLVGLEGFVAPAEQGIVLLPEVLMRILG